MSASGGRWEDSLDAVSTKLAAISFSLMPLCAGQYISLICSTESLFLLCWEISSPRCFGWCLSNQYFLAHRDLVSHSYKPHESNFDYIRESKGHEWYKILMLWRFSLGISMSWFFSLGILMWLFCPLKKCHGMKMSWLNCLHLSMLWCFSSPWITVLWGFGLGILISCYFGLGSLRCSRCVLSSSLLFSSWKQKKSRKIILIILLKNISIIQIYLYTVCISKLE